MPNAKRYPQQQLFALAKDYLIRHKTSEINASTTAKALIQAEIDGHSGHGLSRIQAYANQALCGKVDGFATPQINQISPSAMRINAKYGFAFPALKLAIENLIETTQKSVITIASIYNSHHCGALGMHVEALAEAGLLGLMMANAPHAIAPWGGTQSLFGTNPIALAAPRQNNPPLVIDLGMSISARGKVMAAAQKGEAIPKGIALDTNGKPTTNANDALKGTMLPIGDAKGTALCLLVEVLTAALANANLSFEADSFLDSKGKPPAVAQTIIAINPNDLSNNNFASRIETLINAILNQKGTRLPGTQRLKNREDCQKNGIPLSENLYELLTNF